MNEKPKEYCGIFGVMGVPKAAELVLIGLETLQHRGQESCGIISSNGERFFVHKGMGLVSQVFRDTAIDNLDGSMAIGHNRYATTGSSELSNAQPLSRLYKHGWIAIAHNGNLTNTVRLREELEKTGAMFQTTTDSEVILLLLAQSKVPLEEAIIEMMGKVEGSYSLVIMTTDKLIAIRDPYGYRPLSIGSLDGNPVVASETCAFDHIHARFVRDVQPGEIVIFDKDGERSLQSREQHTLEEQQFCSFESIYFSRPDSLFGGRSIYEARDQMGQMLAKEHPIDADMVVPIPSSGTCAAIGYARARKIPFVMAFIRNYYISRSFIIPSPDGRERAVNLKLNLIEGLVRGKRVIVIDDSIVRGTTSNARVRAIREAGATEVHMLVSSPPIQHPCFYGIDFPDKDSLVAAHKTPQEIGEMLGVDSLHYLSEDGLREVLGPGHCMACFNGNRPRSKT